MTEEDIKHMMELVAIEMMAAYTKGLMEGFKLGRQFVLADIGVKEQ